MDSDCWWIDQSWPGPQALTEMEEFSQGMILVSRQFGKTLAQLGTGMSSLFKAYEPVLKLLSPEPALKNGPVSDSPRSLTALRGRDWMAPDELLLGRRDLRLLTQAAGLKAATFARRTHTSISARNSRSRRNRT
jgi:hypothetical protein